jgi:endonuclease YncB( thermonuclease family)
MESSRQKTYKQQTAIQFIPAVFFFIPPTSPFLSTPNRFKVVLVGNGDSNRVMDNGNASTISIAGIEVLDTSRKRHDYSHIFIIESLKHFACLNLNKSVKIKPYDTDRHGRILGGSFSTAPISIWKCWKPDWLRFAMGGGWGNRWRFGYTFCI